MNLRESQPFPSRRNCDHLLGNPWESVQNRNFVPRKGVCGRARVGKWAARQQQLRNARWMQADYCCTCSVVLVYSRVCSRPSAFTSRRDMTSWLALISRNSCEKDGSPSNSFSTREGRSGPNPIHASRSVSRSKWVTMWMLCCTIPILWLATVSDCFKVLIAHLLRPDKQKGD